MLDCLPSSESVGDKLPSGLCSLSPSLVNFVMTPSDALCPVCGAVPEVPALEDDPLSLSSNCCSSSILRSQYDFVFCFASIIELVSTASVDEQGEVNKE